MPESYPAWAIVAGIIGAVGGLSGVAALINSLTKANATRVEYWIKVVRDQRERIEKLEEDVKKWKAYALSLCRWARGQGLEPPSIDDVGKE
jgi:hypothetical protein